MTEDQLTPDFSGDDFVDNKEIQKARAERLAYEKMVQECLNIIRHDLNGQDSSHINFKGFYMFRSLSATVRKTLKSTLNNKEVKVSLAEYHSAFPTAKDQNSGSDEYLFGYISLKTNYPRTYIHKETLKDKFEDIILKRDVDFNHSKEFSKKFQVMTEDKKRLEDIFRLKRLDNLTAFPEMELEFFNNSVFFRCSRKPVSINQTETFCLLTRVLTTLLD